MSMETRKMAAARQAELLAMRMALDLEAAMRRADVSISALAALLRVERMEVIGYLSGSPDVEMAKMSVAFSALGFKVSIALNPKVRR